MSLSHNWRLSEVAIYFMVIATIIDMGGGLYIKYLSYLFATVVLFLQRRFEVDKKGLWIFILLYVVGPVCAAVIGILNGAKLNSLIIQTTPFIPAVILYVLVSDRDIGIFFKSFEFAALVIAIMTILIYILFMVSPMLKVIITAFMDSHNMGFFGNKDIEGSFFPNVYFKSVLFLNFAFVLTLFNKENFKGFLIFFGIVLSFSKSAIIFAILSWVYFYGRIIKLKKNSIYVSIKNVIILSVAFTCVLYFVVRYYDDILLFYDYFVNALTGRSETTIVRIKHFESILDLFEEHPYYAIWGQGVGTRFFSTGFGYMTDNIEIDHINTIRKFGLVWSLFFYSLIAWEIVKLFKSKNRGLRAVGLAYLTTFILVGTNPLLINPLFLMITVIVYKLIPVKNYKYGFCMHDII